MTQKKYTDEEIEALDKMVQIEHKIDGFFQRRAYDIGHIAKAFIETGVIAIGLSFAFNTMVELTGISSPIPDWFIWGTIGALIGGSYTMSRNADPYLKKAAKPFLTGMVIDIAIKTLIQDGRLWGPWGPKQKRDDRDLPDAPQEWIDLQNRNIVLWPLAAAIIGFTAFAGASLTFDFLPDFD